MGSLGSPGNDPHIAWASHLMEYFNLFYPNLQTFPPEHRTFYGYATFPDKSKHQCWLAAHDIHDIKLYSILYIICICMYVNANVNANKNDMQTQTQMQMQM
jgi:hypothetical protein